LIVSQWTYGGSDMNPLWAAPGAVASLLAGGAIRGRVLRLSVAGGDTERIACPRWLAKHVPSTSRPPKEHRMLKVFAFLQNLPLRRDDHGITAVEYALLLIGIGVAVAIVAIFFGRQLVHPFSKFTSDF
jgi:Flp pilus assembly pilin Flp